MFFAWLYMISIVKSVQHYCILMCIISYTNITIGQCCVYVCINPPPPKVKKKETLHLIWIFLLMKLLQTTTTTTSIIILLLSYQVSIKNIIRLRKRKEEFCLMQTLAVKRRVYYIPGSMIHFKYHFVNNSHHLFCFKN